MEVYTGLIEFGWTSVMIVINLVILYLILKRFFFKKIRKFMLDRQDAVKDAFDAAEAINNKADLKMNDYNKKIADVKQESREIIKNAKIKAESQAKEIIDEATQNAATMMVAAEKQIKREKEKTISEMKGQVAALALLAAEKIVEREIAIVGQDQIVEEIIEEAGTSKWQS
ncbi:MAG: F0F1 ATP synthase subunit B [Anaerovoracaceae bacterium]